MARYWKQRRRLMQGGNEGRGEVEVSHLDLGYEITAGKNQTVEEPAEHSYRE